MNKNKKQTLKVLSGLALASTLVATGTHNVDAKVYRPEMKVENGKYFVRTSDESAKGKAILVSHSDNERLKQKLYGTVISFAPTEDPTQYKEIPSFAGIKESDVIVVRDTENIGDEETWQNPDVIEKDEKEFLENKVTVKTALENGKMGKEVKETSTEKEKKTPTKPQTQPQQGLNKNNELVKDQKTKQERVNKTEETQKQQIIQTEKKADTTKKPLPKTTASSNTGLATFGGLSLISLMVFLGLRKKQK